MARTVVTSAQAPAAIGPYSQAIRTGQMLFTSGQIPLDPASGALVTGDIAKETERVMHNLQAVLRAGGADFRHVTRATVYLTDLGNFQTLNSIYAEYFGNHKPARSTVGVAQLPRGAQVEVDLIAVL